MKCRFITIQILKALREQKRNYGTIDRIDFDFRNVGSTRVDTSAYIHCRYCRQGGHGGTIAMEISDIENANHYCVVIRRYLKGKNLGQRRDYTTVTDEQTPDQIIKKVMEFIYEGFLILRAGMFNLPEAVEIHAAMAQNIPCYQQAEGDAIPW